MMSKKGDCLTIKSSKSTTPVFQILAEEFKAFVFEKDRMEHQKNSMKIALSTLMAYHHFDSDVESVFHRF